LADRIDTDNAAPPELGEQDSVEIHKPKQWHGPREFAKELLTIMLGVLMALGAEQVAETLHWNREVSEARDALKDEMLSNARSARYSALEDTCALARLDEFAAWARGGPRPFAVNQAAFPTLGDSVWDVAKTGQAAARMPLKERLAYAQFYNAAANQMLVLAEVRKAVSVQLGRYEGKETATPGDADRIAEDVAEARIMLRIHLGNSKVIYRQAVALAGTPPPMAQPFQERLANLCDGKIPNAENVLAPGP
jgi:hypothetical protein